MQLNDLLIAKDIDPASVLVLRHRPREVELRRALPWLAAEKPDVFKAYQQAQWPHVEKAMTKAKHIAAFIGQEARKATFVGLYVVAGRRQISRKQFWKIPQNIILGSLGMAGMTEDRLTTLWFDLKLIDFHCDWKGKLIVDWPGLERSWWRWAFRNELRVAAILTESAFDKVMPDWSSLVLTWSELTVLPPTWRAALSQWRGIYLILDTLDGKGYVGSAYGSDNILGRWLHYSKSGHGGNIKLRARNPKNLRFCILERVSPDMGINEVVLLEGKWKDRLHTRKFGLNIN